MESTRRYGGVCIYLTGCGNYQATVNGKRIITRTLREMRERIDAAKAKGEAAS